MKQILIEIDDEAYEKFMGMVSLCPAVKVVNANEHISVLDGRDVCMAEAIRELRKDGVFRHPGDYAYIMIGVNDDAIKGAGFFYSAREFLDYLKHLNLDKLPGKSTIYDAKARIMGRYPNWTFTDHPTDTEILRRKNVMKRFMSAYLRMKMRLSESFSENG